MILTEETLEFDFGHYAVRKFDDPGHRLSHCMKAVDFIVELENVTVFIEVTGPSMSKDVEKVLAGKIDQELYYKYRDSFLYEWAAERAGRPIHYWVLFDVDALDSKALMDRENALRHKLPLQGPSTWKRAIVDECRVFNLGSWEEYVSNIPIRRVA